MVDLITSDRRAVLAIEFTWLSAGSHESALDVVRASADTGTGAPCPATRFRRWRHG